MGDEPALTVGRLDLPAGGLVVVTGASGAGKSTLLRALAGMLTPMAGSVRIGGADPDALGYEDLVTSVTLIEQGQPAAQRHRRRQPPACPPGRRGR